MGLQFPDYLLHAAPLVAKLIKVLVFNFFSVDCEKETELDIIVWVGRKSEIKKGINYIKGYKRINKLITY